MRLAIADPPSGLTEAHRVAVRAVGVIDSSGGEVRSGGRWTSENGRLAAEVRDALGSTMLGPHGYDQTVSPVSS